MLLVFVFACNQEAKDATKVAFKSINKLDSVVISYWKNIDADTYSYVYKDDKIHITSEYKDSLYILGDRETILKQFKGRIDSLYLSKSEEIYDKRERRYEQIISDYSRLSSVGYYKGDTLFNVETKIGEEFYEIEFSRTFEELIELLDSIIPHKVRNYKSKPVSKNSSTIKDNDPFKFPK